VCDEAERFLGDCLRAGVAYRDSEKAELISLIHRDPEFHRFEDDIDAARDLYSGSKSALDDHLAKHCCWEAIRENASSGMEAKAGDRYR
jgi:hypothetical protein